MTAAIAVRKLQAPSNTETRMPNTGEHPTASESNVTTTIGTSTPITIGLFAVAAGALIAAGGALAKIDNHGDHFKQLDAQIVDLKAEHLADTKESRDKELRTELRMQRVEDVNANVLQAIGKLQGSVERIENATTRTAGGHR